MTLIQELMNQAQAGGLLQSEQIKRFTPSEIFRSLDMRNYLKFARRFRPWWPPSNLTWPWPWAPLA